MNLDQILDSIYQLPEQSRADFKNCITEKDFPKGTIILKADKIESKIYLIKKGFVRAYTSTANQDVTFWFGKEGEAVVSMRSYVAQKKSYETIELLENSSLYEVDTNVLFRLYEEDLHIANWGRRFIEKELLILEERFIFRQIHSAKDRYLNLLKSNPEFLQRISLGHIASYLGITQVSLSRIRAEIK